MVFSPDNINDVRLELKQPADRGILTETEPGLFTQPRPQSTDVATTRRLSRTKRRIGYQVSYRPLRSRSTPGP